MKIDEIDDLAVAKQVMRLLEEQNARLTDKLNELAEKLSKLLGTDSARQLEIEIVKLQEEKALLEKRVFGRSSERQSREREDKERTEHPGHGPRKQPELPFEERVHGFEGTVSCGLCGAHVETWSDQFEESEEITVVQRRFVILKHKRQKARCRCYAKVVTAPGPTKLIPGGRYDRIRSRRGGVQVPRSPTAATTGAHDGAGWLARRLADPVGSAQRVGGSSEADA
jgi:hypothetical protein